MGETLREALREIAAGPAGFIADVVHFLVLAAVIAWWGRRAVARKLSGRRARIAAELVGAEQAERESTTLRGEAQAVIVRAEEEVSRLVQAAREEAEKEREAAIAEAQADAERTIRQARESVEREKAKVVMEASERLVRLTAQTARRYVDELLTESERRVVTEKAILEGLAEMEREGVPRPVE